MLGTLFICKLFKVLLKSKLKCDIIALTSFIGKNEEAIALNRQEILEKSRKENNDEGMVYAQNRGRMFGYIGFGIVFLFIIIFNLFNGRDSYAPMAMFWAFICFESYPKFIFTKRKSYLALTILSAVTTLSFLICFIMETLN